MHKVIIISGPTASGKSSLAIDVAKLFNGEIISADSMQIYYGMDIGTAKITQLEKQGIEHHCIDMIAPDQKYSIAQFQADARKAISDIVYRGKLPIVVGGSGLYIQSLVFDYDFSESKKLDFERYDDIETTTIYESLQKIDCVSAEKIDPANRRRLIQALAIAEQTEKTKSKREAEQEKKLLFDIYPIAILPERAHLYETINMRVDQMLRSGLLAEVEYFNTTYELAEQVKLAIGYKVPLEYLMSGKMTYEEMVEKTKQDTRKFAKRQMTWIRNQKISYIRCDGNGIDDKLAGIESFLKG
ncbi:delta(2)-isopentenylpyrophosphate tRNA-adenosine transferase [Erysipelotrichaceae bacterium]|nr:delta(2)-isopentenylpyrophosphate tRNA-adenosine transferase [Erysipelotrichaceae bacterium]